LQLGTLKKDDFEEGRVQMDIPAQNIFIHEAYDAATITNDIAALKLPLAIVLPKKKTDNCESFLVRYNNQAYIVLKLLTLFV
jgi:hypothetical protein